MAKNLLPKTVDPEEADRLLQEDSNFRYSIMEGGYVSSDREVIMVTDRRPYKGMCLAFRQPTDAQQKWIDYLCNLFQLKDGDGNG